MAQKVSGSSPPILVGSRAVQGAIRHVSEPACQTSGTEANVSTKLRVLDGLARVVTAARQGSSRLATDGMTAVALASWTVKDAVTKIGKYSGVRKDASCSP